MAVNLFDNGIATIIKDREWLEEEEKNHPFPFTPGHTESSPSGNMVVIVKKITPIDPSDPQYPSWADQVDMGQLSVDENGVVMAYDL